MRKAYVFFNYLFILEDIVIFTFLHSGLVVYFYVYFLNYYSYFYSLLRSLLQGLTLSTLSLANWVIQILVFLRIVPHWQCMIIWYKSYVLRIYDFSISLFFSSSYVSKYPPELIFDRVVVLPFSRGLRNGVIGASKLLRRVGKVMVVLLATITILPFKLTIMVRMSGLWKQKCGMARLRDGSIVSGL